MQIILLAGGDGSRLWPLSNEARSKQFLRILRDERSGRAESMVQRIVRQIREAGIESPITVAANAQQADAIAAHTGKGVTPVSEPSRRGTFPAVCLACEYLAKVKGVAPDETVVVMPCDQYTQSGYFDVVKKMGELVARDTAKLVAMGVLPDYPSSNYGYILPAGRKEGNGDSHGVGEFREKPDEETAKRLLAKGAYWNGGVFAFRLGFLLALAAKYVKASSFDEVKARYSEFPSTSFDYEVAEKTEGMAMIPFTGLWKDLGTWESLLSEVDEQTSGSVVVGKNENTHVLNELQIPILCVGTKNLVVAASADGILIADKDQTKTIKEYTSVFKKRPMFEERRWGTYQVVDHVTFPDGYETLTKRLTLNPGCSISYQRHDCRDETWTFLDGEGTIVIEDERRFVRRGDTISIKRGVKHALRAETSLTFIEVQAGSNLIEADIERFPLDW